MSYFVFYCYLLYVVADQLPRLRKTELICLLSFTCNYESDPRSNANTSITLK